MHACVLIAGDFVPQYRVKDLLEKNKFDVVLEEVKTITSQCDFNLVNLEAPIVVSPECQRIKKNGPNLSANLRAIEALEYAGFNAVTLANNHIGDYGEWGVSDTLFYTTKVKLSIVGAGMDETEAEKVLYKDINGITFAIINCCEHEFGIAAKAKAGANGLNPIHQYRSIREAKKKADYIIVIVHGGHEMWQLPSPRMVETYRFFIDAGADVVVNHHQHCYSGYEKYSGKYIFYGLGNLCFDNPRYRNDIWNEGYMLKLTFGSELAFELIPYQQCTEQPRITLLKNRKSFDDRIEEINETIKSPNLLQFATDMYYKATSIGMKSAFDLVNNKYFRWLQNKGWMPSLLSEKKRLKMENLIACESHRDKVTYALSHSY